MRRQGDQRSSGDTAPSKRVSYGTRPVREYYLTLFPWLTTASLRMNSINTSCVSSSADVMSSNTEFRYSRAFAWLMLLRAANAFLLQVLSFSAPKKVCMSSGASGMRCSARWNIDWTAKTAFLRTYACRCSRQPLREESKGSSNSGSLSLQRKRSVAPRIYSLGCWRSLRIPLLKGC